MLFLARANKPIDGFGQLPGPGGFQCLRALLLTTPGCTPNAWLDAAQTPSQSIRCFMQCIQHPCESATCDASQRMQPDLSELTSAMACKMRACQATSGNTVSKSACKCCLMQRLLRSYRVAKGEAQRVYTGEDAPRQTSTCIWRKSGTQPTLAGTRWIRALLSRLRALRLS